MVKLYLQQDRSHEHLVCCVEQLPVLELYGRPKGEKQQYDVEPADRQEDGQDVELVRRKVVVEKVCPLAVGQPKLVPAQAYVS